MLDNIVIFMFFFYLNKSSAMLIDPRVTLISEIIIIIMPILSCRRLQLEPLAFLWHHDQSQLLQDMIDNNLTAIIIKVASIG